MSQNEVFRLFPPTSSGFALLADIIAALPDPAGCTCATRADDVDLTHAVP